MSIPAFVGRYRIQREIGRGAFATVVRAWDEDLDSAVALKILHAGRDGPEIQDRFLDEARLFRRIRSYAVIGVHDVGRLGDGRPYIVMDYADLGTLKDRVVRAAAAADADAAIAGHIGLPLADLVQLIDGLADGLTALHRAGVVHRDLKPDNILYQSIFRAEPPAEAETEIIHPGELERMPEPVAAAASRILIADLGIAKDLVSRTSKATVLGGTPAYRAPEQLDPSAEVTPAADIFGASGVLWYAITGTAPPYPSEREKRIEGLPEVWQPFFRQALDPDPRHRFESAETWSAAAHDVLAQLAAAGHGGTDAQLLRARADTAECPYLGLNVFQPEDSDRFFGREKLVVDLLRRLRSQRVLVVGGPSGSGKSSLVRAGLVAALRRGEIAGSESWRIDICTPGRDALAELYFRLRDPDRPASVDLESFVARPTLARQIAGTGSDAPARVLVVDQFEELFTLNPPGDAAKFVEALSALTDPANSPVRVIITVRADFYAACAGLPWLADAITQNQVLVGPLDNRELRRAVVEPARLAGAYLERALVDAIIDDAGGGTGALPLVSHAMVETWARRKGTTLTLEGYRAAGGVAGAIRQTADAVYDQQLNETGRATARRLLLSLVMPGDGTPDTRRILDRAELEKVPEADQLMRVVDRLTDARLLTVDEQSVQMAHEALLHSWPRLRDWIDEARDDLRTQLRFIQQAKDWREAGQDPDLLLRGTRLALGQDWLQRTGAAAGPQERAFIEASIAAQARAEAARAARERRDRRRRALVTTGLAALALGASLSSLVAVRESRSARENESRAEAATAIANERFAAALGAAAYGYVSDDPLLALALAVQSIARAEDPDSTFDARRTLIAARTALAGGGPVVLGGPVPAGDALSLAMTPKSDFVALGRRDGSLAIVDAATRRPVGRVVESGLGGIEDLIVIADDLLVAAGNTGRIAAWSISDGLFGPRMEIGKASDAVWSIAAWPDRTAVATASEDGVLAYWPLDGSGGHELVRRHGDFTSLAFSPDGSEMIAGTGSGSISAWSLPGRDRLFHPLTEAHGSDVWKIVVSPAGDRFATVSSDRRSALVTLPDGRFLGHVFSADREIGAVAFVNDGTALLGGGEDGQLHVWDIAAARETTVSGLGHRGAIRDLVISGDGTRAATLGSDQQIRFWQLATPVPVAETFALPEGRAKGVALGADTVVSGDDRGGVRLWDAAGEGQGRLVQEHGHQVWAVALSPDGGRVAAADRDGDIVVSDRASGDELLRIVAADDSIWTVAFLPEGGALLTASDTTLRLWDAASGALRRDIPVPGGGLTRAALSPDGTRLAASTASGDVLLWDLGDEDGEARRIAVDDDLVWTVRFSPDGSHLLAGTSDEVLTILDVESGQIEAAFTGHSGGVTDALFLADGATLVVADRRGALHFWDLPSRRRIGRIPDAHRGAIWRLALADDGVRFASSGDDGTVRVWDILSSARACAISADAFDQPRRRQYLGTAAAASQCDGIP